MPEIMQEPQSPEEVARLAGKDIYGTSVGILRRVELWRLGNAWGLKFPVGASKDYMIPFFKQLEAEGKNPLRPPVDGNLDEIVSKRDVKFSAENHSERGDDPYALIPPEPMSDFEKSLAKLHHGQLKKICKLRGIKHARTDRKQDIIARIVSEGTSFDDIPDSSQ